MQNNPFEEQYQKWLNRKDKKVEKSIPHIIHHIWLGSELPQKYVPFINSFKKFNPDWKFILWDEKKILELPDFKFKKEFCKISNFGTKSDIARYEILKQYGGFYFDTDFECLKSLDEIADTSSFVAGLQFYDQPGFGNAMMASAPDTFLINEILRNLKPTNSSDVMEVMRGTGPCLITDLFKDNLDKMDSSVALLPAEYFFAVPNSECTRVVEAKAEYVSDKSYAIHYWDQSWIQNDLLHRFVRKIKKFVKAKN